MILVTGGTGLVGSHLVQTLVNKGEKVRVLKRKSSDTSVFEKFLGNAALKDQVEWAEGDVLDIFSLEDALVGINKVYHTAAVVSFHKQDITRMGKINELGTANVVNACLSIGIEKLCHVSSVAALGRSADNEIISEETEWKTSKSNSEYAKTKYASEREVWRGIAEGLNAVIVNPSIILGPANWNTGSSALFRTVYKGLKYYPVGVNAFVDVRDVVDVMIELMESPVAGERFVVMAENLSYQSVLTKIAAKLKVQAPSVKVSPTMAELAWIIFGIRRFFTGKPGTVTKETARTSSHPYLYSNKKLLSFTGHTFRSIDDTIDYTGAVFLKSNS